MFSLGFSKASALVTFTMVGLSPLADAKVGSSADKSSPFLVIPIASNSSIQSSNWDKIRSEIARGTTIPFVVPTFIPYIDESNPVAASLVSATPTGYEIALGWGEDCFSPEMKFGAGACHYGSIEGSSTDFTDDEGRKLSVLLENGLHGRFVDFTCGAHCGDSSIVWKDGRYFYRIRLKAESLGNLKRVVNSAIAQQHQSGAKRSK